MAFRQRKVRKKRTWEEFEDDEDESPTGAGPLLKSRSEKGKSNTKTLLSFGDEEERVEDVKLRKKSGRGRAAVNPVAISSDVADVNTQQTKAGEYSKERLKALKKELAQTPSHFKTAAIEDPGAVPGLKPSAAGSQEQQPVIRLSGSFKQRRDERFEIEPAAVVHEGKGKEAGGEGGEGDEQEGEEENPLPPPPRRGGGADDPHAPSRVVVEPDAEEEEDDGDFQVPDEATIRRAKAKREALREARLAPEYIPLGGATALTSRDYKRQEDKLHVVDEDRGSDDEADEHVRIAMAVSAPAGSSKQCVSNPVGCTTWVKGARRVKQFLQSDSQAGGASARPVSGNKAGFKPEQLRRWLRPARDVQQYAEHAFDEDDTLQGLARPGRAATSLGGPSIRAGGSSLQAVALAGEEVLKALQEALERSSAAAQRLDRDLRRNQDSLVAAVAAVQQLEAESEAAGSRYRAMQELRLWMGDLCDMLSHKAAIVEELEEQMVALMDQRSDALRSRQRVILQETQGPALAALKAAHKVLEEQGLQATGVAAAAAFEAGTAEEQEALQRTLPEKLDEFGRDENLLLRREAEARSAARRPRLSACMQTLSKGRGALVVADIRPEDPEDPTEIRSYERRREEILQAAGTTFADASEEFGTLEAVAVRMTRMKTEHGKEYADVYMAESVPALFAPFVRMQLLQWDALFRPADMFEQHAWFRQLCSYGERSSGGYGEDDPDQNLVPKLVSNLVVPLVLHMLQNCWQPSQALQAPAAAALLEALLVYLPPSDPGLQAALASIKQQLGDAVAACQLPDWPSAAVAVAPHAALHLALHWGDAVGLLQREARRVCSPQQLQFLLPDLQLRLLVPAAELAIAAFDGKLAESFVRSLALSRLLCQALLPFLTRLADSLSNQVACLAAVAKALPKTWLKPAVAEEAAGLVDLARSAAARALAQPTSLPRPLLEQLRDVCDLLALESEAARLRGLGV